MRATQRSRCPTCGYATVACVCRWVQPMSLPVTVVILQDALERKSAKSTVPLLQLALPQLEVIALDDADAVAGLQARVQAESAEWGLVYPTTESRNIERTVAEELGVLPTAWLFPDGTWKKTRRMLYENPWLSAINSFSFSQAPESLYRIRKVPGRTACSTLESVAWVLQCTQSVDPTPLYELQRAFVAQWQSHQPAMHRR